MNLMNLLATAYGGRTYTLSEFKMNMETSDRSLKREIDSCPDGRVVRRTLELPSRCTPHRADLCCVEHEGQYAMMVDTNVYYYGTDPYLYQLFRDRMIIFDSWYDLVRFWHWLPYVD